MASSNFSQTVQYHEFHKKFDLNPYQSFMEKHLQHYGYYSAKNENDKTYSRDVAFRGGEQTENDENGDDTKSNQVQMTLKDGKQIQKLKEPRNLFALMVGSNVGARYPFDMQVLPKSVTHIDYVPDQPEPLYKPSGAEPCPMVKGEERGGILVYQYIASYTDYFVRSTVHGTSMLRPVNFSDSATATANNLQFESRFESANLEEVLKVGPYEYELSLRYDLYTEKHTQWFYFQVSNAKPGATYRFTIVNLIKSNSLYNSGMKPCFYSEIDAKTKNIGWRREGFDIKYYRNNTQRPDCHRPFYSLTFSFIFENSPEDKCYFAHCYPYTYTMLQKYLKDIADDSNKSKICKQRILCKTLGGNIAYVLTVTNPVKTELGQPLKPTMRGNLGGKKSVVITARVHPGESNASWMMKGVLDYLLSDSPDANLLREFFIFKIVPMLNPDGVIVGNYRCSLAGRDLNRNYKTVLRDAYPTIWYTRQLIKKLRDEIGVVLYVDLHGHSRKQNVFMYGCEKLSVSGQRLKSRVFPYMLAKNSQSAFSYKSSKFRVQKSKEGCGRICMWNMGINNSYTMESTFCGSTLGQKKGFHFNTRDLELLGFQLLDTLLDFSDPNPIKYAKVLTELELELKREIMKKWEAKGIKRDISTISDKELAQMLDDVSDSEVESSTSGSDSSDDNGLPVHLMEMAQQSLKTSVKRLKTKKELNKYRRATFANVDNNPTPLRTNKNYMLAGNEKTSRQTYQESNSDNRQRNPKLADDTESKQKREFRDESASSKKSLMRYTTQKRDQSLMNLRETDSGPSRAAGLVDFGDLCNEHQTALAEVEVFEANGLTKKGTTRRDVSTQFTPLPQTHKHVLETSAAQQRQQDKLREAKIRAESMLAPFGEFNQLKSSKKSLQVMNAMQQQSSPNLLSTSYNQATRNLEKAYKEQSSLHWLPKQIRKSNNNIVKQISNSTTSSKDRIIPAASFQPRPRVTQGGGTLTETSSIPNNTLAYPRQTEMPQLSLTERLMSTNGITTGLTSEALSINQNPGYETKGLFATHLKLNGASSQRELEPAMNDKTESRTINSNPNLPDASNTFAKTTNDDSKTKPKPTVKETEVAKIKTKNEGINYLKASHQRNANEDRRQRERTSDFEDFSVVKRSESRMLQEARSESRNKRLENFAHTFTTERYDRKATIGNKENTETELRELSVYDDSDCNSEHQNPEPIVWTSNITKSKSRNKISVDDSFVDAQKLGPKNRVSSGGQKKQVTIMEPNLSEDDQVDPTVPLTPQLIEIQEEKVRLASAKSEVRHRKLKFTDAGQNENQQNEESKNHEPENEPLMGLTKNRKPEGSTAKAKITKQTLEPIDYCHLETKEYTFGRMRTSKSLNMKLSDSEFRSDLRQDNSSDGSNNSTTVNPFYSVAQNVSKFEHNIPLSPRPISDHSLMLNRDLRPPVHRYDSSKKKVESEMKN